MYTCKYNNARVKKVETKMYFMKRKLMLDNTPLINQLVTKLCIFVPNMMLYLSNYFVHP